MRETQKANLWRNLTGTTCFAALIAAGTIAPTVAAEDERASGGLEEIVITASKREQTLQEAGMAVTAIGAMVGLLPSFLSRVEYRLSESSLEKRRVKQKEPAQFKELFRFPELDYLVPMKYGFKYYKMMDSVTPLKNFFNRHISDQYSGEVHLEKADRDRILKHLAERGVSFSKPKRS